MHLSAAYQGGFRALSASLYPLESGFALPTDFLQNITDLLGVDLDKAIGSVIGIDSEAVVFIRQRSYSYYSFLLREAQNLSFGIRNYRSADGHDLSYRIVSNYHELQATVQDDPHSIALVLSVEGAHSFIDDVIDPLRTRLERQVYQKRVRREARAWADKTCAQIDDYKSRYPETFFVTYAHHFFNLMCGHAYTFSRIMFNQRPARYGLKGINRYGWQMLERLLERKTVNGQKLRRLLIDTKHMSVRSRQEYHDFVFNARQVRDWIPIIQSHTAASGRASMRQVVQLQDGGKNWRKGPYPEEDVKYPGQLVDLGLNLFDDEIREIIDSDGLIGIMLDEKRILGKKLPEDISQIEAARLTLDVVGAKKLLEKYVGKPGVKRKFLKKDYFHRKYVVNRCSKFKHAKKLLGIFLFVQKYCAQQLDAGGLDDQTQAVLVEDQQQIQEVIDHIRSRLKPISASLILHQVLYLSEVGGSAALDHLCIGSDFDGVINPLDTYPDASYLGTLSQDLLSHWTEMRLKGVERYEKHRRGLTPQVIIQKLLWGNADRFMSRYFTDEYLADGIHPDVPEIQWPAV